LVAQNANGENPDGPSDIAGFLYREELRGLSPEPIVHEGVFVPEVVEVDPGFQSILRDPFFRKDADYSGPRSEQYRSLDSSDEAVLSALDLVRNASEVVALTARPGDAGEFLLASDPRLGDGFDSLPPLRYLPEDESTYEQFLDRRDKLSSLLAYSINTATPILRRMKSTPEARDLRALLRTVFTYSAIKTLEAERDLRGAQDAGLFSLPLGMEGEDGVLARCIGEYTDALHSLLSGLAVASAAMTADVEANLAGAEETGLPVLRSAQRDYRLLLRILSGLSQARIELAQNALALQDWPQVLLQHEHMGADVLLALALMDAHGASSLGRSQDLIATMENLSALSRLRRFAEGRQTPASLLVGMQDLRPEERTDGVGQEDYPDLTEPGDPALNRDVKTSLGNLVRQKIQETIGIPGELDTLRDLQAMEQRLRASYLDASRYQREVLNRRYDEARTLKESLGKIVGFLPNGEPAVAPEGQEPTPENDAIAAAVAAWDGAPALSSWVYPWINNQGSLRQTYATIERLRAELTGAHGLSERIRIQVEQIDLLRRSISVENELYRQLVEAQFAGAQSMAEKANEVAQAVGEAVRAQGIWDLIKRPGVKKAGVGEIIEILGDQAIDWVAGKFKSNKIACYAAYTVGGLATGAASSYLPALLVGTALGPVGWTAIGIATAGEAISGYLRASRECKSGEEGSAVQKNEPVGPGKDTSPNSQVQPDSGLTYQSLTNIGRQIGKVDERLIGIQSTLTSQYTLQVKQYQEQLRQGRTLDAILGEERKQTQLASYTVKQLSKLNRLTQVEIVSNAKLAAEGMRIRAIIENKMAQLETARRNADLEARILSLQGELIALLSQFDSVRQQIEVAAGNFFSLIYEAQRLKALWREALARQVTPPSPLQIQRYLEAEEYRRYRAALARLRFKVWKLARLVEYMRNEPFPPFGSSVIDTYSADSRFNYAMVFRARNAGELENALRALQREAERVQGLQPASALVVSLRSHVARSYGAPGSPVLDDEGFRRFLREHNNRPIAFAMTVGGAVPLPQTSGSDAQRSVTERLVDVDRLNYSHLVWAVRVACETSDGSRITGNVHLLQRGTGLLRTVDARPEETDEYGLPRDIYREYHLPDLTSNVALSPSKTLESPTSELYDKPTDPARIWTFQFKNRPLVSVWEITLPPLTEAQIGVIKDIYVVFEVNVRSRPSGAR
jgi:hypothetical protein